MALRRFWLEGQPSIGEHVHVEGDLFHHIRDVCRFEVGDRFELLPGDGKAHLVEITELRKRDLDAKKISERGIEALKKPWIHLVLSVPRFPTAEMIIEKSVELGVHTITFVVSDFSFVRKTSDIPDNRMKRWEKIAISATQQSGRGTLMALNPARELEDALKDFKNKRRDFPRDAQGNSDPSLRRAGLFPYEGEAVQSWHQAIGAVKSDGADEIWLFVGSEGGFSREEVELFQQFGLQPMTMGAQVLRVETACVALVSVIKYEFEV